MTLPSRLLGLDRVLLVLVRVTHVQQQNSQISCGWQIVCLHPVWPSERSSVVFVLVVPSMSSVGSSVGPSSKLKPDLLWGRRR